MPFGLTNSPTTFMCLMHSILSTYLDRFIVIFIYDMLIFSTTKEEHDEHLQMILQVPREHNLYAKFCKWEFFEDKIKYLVHAIPNKVISLDSDKIKEIMEWHVSKEVSYVLSFMGIMGYYQKFRERFLKITNPITSL